MSVSTRSEGDVVVIEFDDGNRNVMNHELLDALEAAFDEVEQSDPGAVVLKGRTGSFCAGYDVSVMTGDDPSAASRLGKRGGQLARRICGFPRPVVGLCEGHAFTIGLIWLACCDVNIAEDGPFKLGMTEVKLDVTLTAWGMEPLLARLNPTDRVPALLHSAIYSPADAQAAGLIDTLVAAGTGGQRAMETAQQLAALPRHGYLSTKLILRKPILDAMAAELVR